MIATITLFVTVISVILINIFSTKIREIYIFNYSSSNLHFKTYEIVIGGFIYRNILCIVPLKIKDYQASPGKLDKEYKAGVWIL